MKRCIMNNVGGDILTVYLDSLFLINAVMDFILIFAALRIAKKNFRLWRIITAAGAGGIFAVCMFFADNGASFILGIPAAALMLVIAYKPHSIKEFFKILMIFYAVSCCMAGVGMLLFFSGRFNGYIKNGVFYIRIPLWLLVISAAVFYALITVSQRILNRIKGRRIVLLAVTYNSEKFFLNALEDSGNFLKEPISGKPVIIADKGIFAAEKIEFFYAVPFHSLGCENGIIYAFKPERIEYQNQTIDAFIGIYNSALSDSGEYNALIGNGICK